MATDITYRNAFERLWDDKSSQIISNGKSDHASALLSVFLTKAEKRVVIFCKELNKSVYDDECVLSALEQAISNQVELIVYVQNNPEPDSKFAARLTAASLLPNNRITFQKELPESVRNLPMNFAYVDERAYRFEQNNGTMEAVASANNPTTVSLLKQLFTRLTDSIRHASAVSHGNT